PDEEHAGHLASVVVPEQDLEAELLPAGGLIPGAPWSRGIAEAAALPLVPGGVAELRPHGAEPRLQHSQLRHSPTGQQVSLIRKGGSEEPPVTDQPCLERPCRKWEPFCALWSASRKR